MAIDITINLNDEDDATLRRLTDDANAGSVGDPLTPSQWLRRNVRDRLRLAAQQYEEQRRLGLRALYLQATATEQAQIDAILDRYRA